MKYLQFGWVIAACTVAAIYLTHVAGTPSASPDAAPRAYVSAGAPVISALANAPSHTELSRAPAAQAHDAQQAEQARPNEALPVTAEAASTSSNAAAVDVASALPVNPNEQTAHDVSAPGALSERESSPSSVEIPPAEWAQRDRDSPEGTELITSFS